MVTYEVSAVVRADLAAAYEKYMRPHIVAVLATGLFVGATFDRAEGNKYRARYQAKDQQSVDKYLAEHTARLRADFAKHFPNGVELSREVWQTTGTWER
ncbi:MAG TPA: DUF4286 family protein [Gemmatimonadaceae bacterium]|nr:DUF4286 family protein [Gemmatimonadaceae bacterium]